MFLHLESPVFPNYRVLLESVYQCHMCYEEADTILNRKTFEKFYALRCIAYAARVQQNGKSIKRDAGHFLCIDGLKVPKD